MNERKLIFWWYDRFEAVNKGILRILAVITLPAVVYFIGSGLFLIGYSIIEMGPMNDYIEEILWGVKLTAGGVGGYVVFWTLFRGILWIVDGFKEN